MKKFVTCCLLTLFFPFISLYSSFCLFYPPSHWQFVDPKHLDKYVLVQYINKNKNGICPSINLASESIATNVNDYLNAVKKIYEEDPKASYIELGKIQTRSGKADLLQITLKAKEGILILLQAILAKNNVAYILTGASSTKEFNRYKKIFLSSLQSMQICDDLVAIVPSPDKQDLLQAKIYLFKQEIQHKKILNQPKLLTKKINQLHQYLSQNYFEMGSYWQFLLIKKALEEIH